MRPSMHYTRRGGVALQTALADRVPGFWTTGNPAHTVPFRDGNQPGAVNDSPVAGLAGCVNHPTGDFSDYTLRRPLRLEQLAERVFAVDGTPTDCVNIGISIVLKKAPALVVSKGDVAIAVFQPRRAAADGSGPTPGACAGNRRAGPGVHMGADQTPAV